MLVLLGALVLSSCGDKSREEQKESSDTPKGADRKKLQKKGRKKEAPPFRVGVWRGVFKLSDEAELPFVFALQEGRNRPYLFRLRNADERIMTNEITIEGDSVIIDMPVFQSELRLKAVQDTLLEGVYIDSSRNGGYRIPFRARHGVQKRFFQAASKPEPGDVEGRWETTFGFQDPGKENYPALGKFDQDEQGRVSGTFMTETGDYRFLDGRMKGDSLFLSTFDGAHLFLFEAELKGNDVLEGKFWSGDHWSTTWRAERNPDFKLTDPDSLTHLKPGYEKVDFTFPDLDSNLVSLSDERFDDKAVIVQVMGSWCPNCMDETRYYAELYKRYKHKGLSIVALAFERADNFQERKKVLEEMVRSFDVEYTVLIAGPADKEVAAEALPMLNHVISFPTSIFIDKQGDVRRIHTGFQGPGTGDPYEKFKEETDSLVKVMLNE